MNQDVNEIINNLSTEYAQQLAQANRKVAILLEENERLKRDAETLKSELESLENNEAE
ncbi:hypothetical protein [Amphibacillus jilinensis]|uniref:hypothetical protein n=1 Tax=Amphibacillus jilinensis TaxID=1216008 RepID=UPI0002ED2110|nr:hypothetical protein [Amphibacillus jilinensis]